LLPYKIISICIRLEDKGARERSDVARKKAMDEIRGKL